MRGNSENGIRRIDDPSVFGGYREICETPEAWQRRRSECCDRARATCENPGCQKFAPPKTMDEADAGDAHHLKKRKVRDDRLCNLRWLCRVCHTKAHIPAKVMPRAQWRVDLMKKREAMQMKSEEGWKRVEEAKLIVDARLESERILKTNIFDVICKDCGLHRVCFTVPTACVKCASLDINVTPALGAIQTR